MGALGHISIWAGPAFALTALLAGCSLVFGFDELVDRLPDAATSPPEPSDGAGDAAIDPGTCNAGLPQAVPQALTGRFITHVIAFDSLRFKPDPGEALGLDLDCTTTTDPSSSSCALDPQITDSFRALLIDGDGGVDDVGGPFLASTAARIPVFDLDKIDQKVRAGQTSIVLQIEGLESIADTPTVDVQVFPARGFFQPDGTCRAWDPGDAGPDPDGAPPQRAGLPTDVWCLDSRFQKEIYGSKVSAVKAWVVDHHLVAQFDRLQIPLIDDVSHRIAYITLVNAWLTAKLYDVGNDRIEARHGMIGGRWPTREIVRQIANVQSAGVDGSCGLAEETRSAARVLLCPGRDIRSDVAMNLDAPCDSLSLGIGFSGYEVAERGRFVTVESYDDQCPLPADGGPHPDQTWDCPTSDAGP